MAEFECNAQNDAEKDGQEQTAPAKKEKKTGTVSKTKLFWGITFIVAALVIIADVVLLSTGVITLEQLPIWRIIVGLVCVIVAVWGIVHKKYWMPIPMLGALFLTFQPQLAALFGAPAINSVPFWAIIAGTALLTVGAIILLHVKKPAVEVNINKNSREYKNSANIVYVDAADLDGHELSNRTGAMEIYFSNIDQYAGNGTLILNNRLGAVTVHLPANWVAIVEIDSRAGAVENKAPTSGDGPILHIRGQNSMGAIEITSEAAGED